MRVDNLIKTDHENVRQIYKLYQQEPSRIYCDISLIIICLDPREKQKYANELIRQLALHSHAEEIIVYPVFEERLRDGKLKANHSRHEHWQLKVFLKQSCFSFDNSSMNCTLLTE